MWRQSTLKEGADEAMRKPMLHDIIVHGVAALMMLPCFVVAYCILTNRWEN